MNRFALSATLVLALFAAAPTLADTFPNRPVTIVVPYPPGGGSDNIARATAAVLSRKWNQPVIVENKPGGNGSIGTRQVIREKPDGYTLLESIPAIAALKYLDTSGDDPLQHLRPVSLLASGPTGLVVRADSGIHSIADLRRVCGEHGAGCTWASGEPFTLLVGIGLLETQGFDKAVNVRYTGTSLAVNDVIGGHVNLLVTGLAAVVPHHKAGTLRILAISGDRRNPEVPDVPTYAEFGMGAATFVNNWYGLFAPKDTPTAVVEAIARDMNEAAQDPSVLKVMAPLLITPVGSSSQEFATIVKKAEEDVGRMSKHLVAD